jgi:hypothetical protein
MMLLGNSHDLGGGGLVHLVEQLIAYEEGLMTEDEQIELFQHLIDTGTCWHLDGHYHRVAATLIEAGLIKPPEKAEANL